MDPKVTVLMSVHNGEKYLREAIESILNQTFKDFEFLIINDGSTDSSKEIILSYDDPRIVYVENETNIGLTKSLNRGLKLAKGKYIARMDADDISLPERLERQLGFMDRNPEIGICGSWLKLVGSGTEWRMPEDSDTIKAMMIFNNSLFHSTVIIRKKVLDYNNLNYNEEFRCAQDYELWSRVKSVSKLYNIQQPLVLYRIHASQVTKTSGEDQEDNAGKIRERLLSELGIVFSDEEMGIYERLARNKIEKSKDFSGKVGELLVKLKNGNEKTGVYDKKTFNNILLDKWFSICEFCANLGFWVWNKFNNSSLCPKEKLESKKKLKFFVKCLIRYNYRK